MEARILPAFLTRALPFLIPGLAFRIQPCLFQVSLSLGHKNESKRLRDGSESLRSTCLQRDDGNGGQVLDADLNNVPAEVCEFLVDALQSHRMKGFFSVEKVEVGRG